ncbi:MAG TPA: hypothetical protein VG407_02435 [Caulobacteraceae bacterium]|jgi:hypothetical protein|nr:hypothetical protein [Caulobacteraceae bacterium]
MPPEKTKVKVKTRVRNRTPREHETFIPIASPTLILFLVVGVLAALGLIYLILKVLTQMGGVPDAV